MNLAATDEELEMAATVDRFLAKELPITRLRDLAAQRLSPAIDDATWASCAGSGWLALALPATHGGLGLGVRADVMLARKLGRHLTPGPFRSTILAAHVAIAARNDGLARAFGTGERRAGIEVGTLTLDARPGDAVVRLADDSLELVEVLDSEPVDGLDPGIRCSRITSARTIALAPDPAATLNSRARLLVAAELLGILEAVRDMSAGYARVRVQFGQPIGAFQAVKHRCAEMAIRSYATSAQVLFAATAFDQGHPDVAFHAAAAHLLAVEAAKQATADNIQNHGAVGFTMEHDAHLFLRRALVLEHLLGPGSMATVLAPTRHEFR